MYKILLPYKLGAVSNFLIQQAILQPLFFPYILMKTLRFTVSLFSRKLT